MWYAWAIKGVAWVAQNWKAVGIGVLILLLASYIGALKMEIGEGERKLAQQASELVKLEGQVQSCEASIERQNARIGNYERELELRARMAEDADKRVAEIRREALEKDRKLMRMRIKAVSCDEALIELGKILNEVDWRK